MNIYIYEPNISNSDNLQGASGYKAYNPLNAEAEHPRFSTNPGHLSCVSKVGGEDTFPPQRKNLWQCSHHSSGVPAPGVHSYTPFHSPESCLCTCAGLSADTGLYTKSCPIEQSLPVIAVLD